MKILFICNEYPPHKHGGIGVFVKNLAEKLTESGIECIVAGLYNILKDQIEISNGVQIYQFKKPVILNLKTKLINSIVIATTEKYYLSKKIKFLEKLHNIDIIESYEWTGPLFTKPKSPLLIRLHGSNSAYANFENKKISKFLFFWEKRNLGMADYIVSVSNHLLKITEGTFGKSFSEKSVIYNSINNELFKPLPEIKRDPNKIIFVGKFLERKGVFELFHILNYLLKSNVQLHFQFVGSYNEGQKLELLNILDPELRIKVLFTNAIPQYQLPIIYNEASLIIIPSRAEAFGLTVIEAMACGCLVAMSNIEIGTELIIDGVDGILINTFEYENSSIKIASLLKDSELCEKMRKNALNKIESIFSNHALVQENIEKYKKIVSQIEN